MALVGIFTLGIFVTAVSFIRLHYVLAIDFADPDTTWLLTEEMMWTGIEVNIGTVSDGRGSLDILWACLATTFLSTWSAIFLNVPDPSDSAWTFFRRKAFITIVTLLGPEYLLMFAMGEWQSAQASVARFKALRGDDLWTLRHGFFANMGGFALKTSDDTCFFLDAAQIAWLLEREAIHERDSTSGFS
ncbi:hypothetical protein K4K59_004835 [Colletotrichum sp. SAR11_240]|nr:hypothetical protein K4K59_004835 [Colletotrichum sp. SAR11_240]